MTDWPDLVKDLTGSLRNLRGGAPEVMKAFANIAQAALTAKALDGKTKELIALAISVAVRCDDCIAFHVKAAFEHGASRDEVAEALGMAIYMGAGPSAMYASHAFEAYAQFEAQKVAAATPPA
ncbi:MAG: carboxymuconolactone decarboxylase family protein [Pseudolabrys sp.]|nr:carboxymuconolactone decarboxylase family protein [Pseudolabrys sp.]MDP2298528.1 carboxymuconolactone decarboxylase family protein [Pseudolabrys sp.]